MNNERNTILKIEATGEYLAYDGNVIHLTTDRANAYPFTAAEVVKQHAYWSMPLVAEDWIIKNWDNDRG